MTCSTPSTPSCNGSSKREDDAREIFEDKWTVSEKIEFILKIIAERGSVRFAELFEGAASRSEVVCTFLALLELIRLKQLACVQPEPFAEIEISRPAVTTTGEPPVVTAAEPAAAMPASERRPMRSRRNRQLRPLLNRIPNRRHNCKSLIKNGTEIHSGIAAVLRAKTASA